MKTTFVLPFLLLSLSGGHRWRWAITPTSMYNMGTPTTLEGTVKSFDWINPHSLLHSRGG